MCRLHYCKKKCEEQFLQKWGNYTRSFQNTSFCLTKISYFTLIGYFFSSLYLIIIIVTGSNYNWHKEIFNIPKSGC